MDILETRIAAAIDTLQQLASQKATIERAAKTVGDCLVSGGKLLVFGNGGSAADAADFATEFSCKFVNDRRPYPALNLAACGSLLTAIGNDYGFEKVFARQIRAFARKGDVALALSTSGNSANIVEALTTAAELGIPTIALLGRDGGKARARASIEIVVPGTATARIQEAHKFLLHVVCEMIEERLCR